MRFVFVLLFLVFLSSFVFGSLSVSVSDSLVRCDVVADVLPCSLSLGSYSVRLDSSNTVDGRFVWSVAGVESGVYDCVLDCGVREVERVVVSDNVPPVVSVSVLSVSDSSVVISVDSSEPVLSKVFFREGSSFVLRKVSRDSVIVVSGLSPGSDYFFRVESCDASGNCVFSSLFSFSTRDFVSRVGSLSLNSSVNDSLNDSVNDSFVNVSDGGFSGGVSSPSVTGFVVFSSFSAFFWVFVFFLFLFLFFLFFKVFKS